MYQVVWVRSLSLVFGGTHLAVTTVLAIFMAGLATGGYLFGKHIDALTRPMFVYGLLECGIALFAILFAGLMAVYPSIYNVFVLSDDVSPVYLFVVRVIFSTVALIAPATLMGGTLPVLASCLSIKKDDTGSRLSLLYGFNTLGAVAGAAAAGFYLLRYYSVSTTLISAVSINLIIGAGALLWQRSASCPVHPAADLHKDMKQSQTANDMAAEDDSKRARGVSQKLVLWGIGISGFCALGYEVLWTRILVIVVGGSVYGFTIMLIAFLIGIALGSKFYGLFARALNACVKRSGRFVIGFGSVQIIIGVTALIASYYVRFLPAKSMHLQEYLVGTGIPIVDARLLGNFLLACAYMIVPAFFMGLAFPVAVNINSSAEKEIGRATGEVLAFNTIGAIAGAAVSGFVLIYFFGIERSLQMLVSINAGLGIIIIAGTAGSKVLNRILPILLLVALVFLGVDRQSLRMWDPRYFAIFRNNQPEAFNTPEKMLEAIENTDVLFTAEGVETTISVIRTRAGNQALLVNGKVVASSALQDRQCQYTLGHLPMLLHRKPAKVLVVGLGTGMTLGATSVHPSVREVTLAEIEPGVVPAARIFRKYNHDVLDNPKLKIVFNDGRNFLMTTKRKFDVITADPIHPWTQGSGYLYTREYFRLASEHLLPGGVMCQWLPIYELSVRDLQSVIKTFGESFRYTMLWLTHYDAELVGSNAPIMPDENEIDRRISSVPEVQSDLKRVMMGSGSSLLSYFVMGTERLKAFSESGIINTDDNLYLEFSAPFSAGINIMRGNVVAIEQYRESILPFLANSKNGMNSEGRRKRWEANFEAAELYGAAHALYLGQQYSSPEFLKTLERLNTDYPGFAPAKFLMNEYRAEIARTPALLQKVSITLLSGAGTAFAVEISAVTSRISSEIAVIDFVDNRAKTIFGEIFVPGSDDELTRNVSGVVMGEIDRVYKQEAASALLNGYAYPAAETALGKIRNAVSAVTGNLNKKMDAE